MPFVFDTFPEGLVGNHSVTCVQIPAASVLLNSFAFTVEQAVSTPSYLLNDQLFKMSLLFVKENQQIFET